MKYDYDFCKKIYDAFTLNEEYIGIASVGRAFGLSRCQCKKLREKMERFYDGNELEKIYRHRIAKYANSKRKNTKHTAEAIRKISSSNKKSWEKDDGKRRRKNKELMIKNCWPKTQLESARKKRVETRKNNGKPWHSDETKEKIKNSQTNKKMSSGCKLKMRKSAIKRIEERYKFQIRPNFNMNICYFFDKLNKKYNLKIQHAMNGGEFYIKDLGYWADGYDKEKNIIIEYDERGHKYKKEKDVLRENEIKNYLNCKFFRIKEKNFISDMKKILIYIKE